MAGRKRFSVMREPVHGDVYLTHDELRVLDTPEMQRLRGIKQLGTTYLVFPGALHTRFDHSIGTVHVTQKMIDAINLSFELDPAGTVQVSEEEARVIRIAALLHDITHIPSGHNIEDQDGLFERHDSAYRYRRMFERTGCAPHHSTTHHPAPPPHTATTSPVCTGTTATAESAETTGADSGKARQTRTTK